MLRQPWRPQHKHSLLTFAFALECYNCDLRFGANAILRWRVAPSLTAAALLPPACLDHLKEITLDHQSCLGEQLFLSMVSCWGEVEKKTG